MKRVVIEIDITTGEMSLDAQGFQGRQCDEVLKQVVSELEEAETKYKTPVVNENKNKNMQTIDISLI
jgi:hypothetical protein